MFTCVPKSSIKFVLQAEKGKLVILKSATPF